MDIFVFKDKEDCYWLSPITAASSFQSRKIESPTDREESYSLYGMRTIYNETYFIPEFASADLAYLLLEKVAASTNEKAIGFEPGGGEAELVQKAMVPVAQLYIGYLSNKQEQKLLAREEHIDRIATGICDAVLAGYEEMKK